MIVVDLAEVSQVNPAASAALAQAHSEHGQDKTDDNERRSSANKQPSIINVSTATAIYLHNGLSSCFEMFWPVGTFACWNFKYIHIVTETRRPSKMI